MAIKTSNLPLMPLRDLVVYPLMNASFLLGCPKSINAANEAIRTHGLILLFLQKNPNVNVPNFDDLFDVGVLARVNQFKSQRDGIKRIVVAGLQRVILHDLEVADGYFIGSYHPVPNPKETSSPESIALIRLLRDEFDDLAKLNKKISPKTITALSAISKPSDVADFLANHITQDIATKQKLLETIDVNKRLELIAKIIEKDLEILQLEKRIRQRIKKQMEKNQREYYLHEQIKAIQEELGEETNDELNELRARVEEAHLPPEAKALAVKSLRKFQFLSPTGAEAHIFRSQIDWITSVPWKVYLPPDIDILSVRTQIEQYHFGADDISDWLVEQVSLLKLGSTTVQPLCFIGPPGVGKTSLGGAIAKALKRQFVVVPLGGVSDSAYLKGNYRIYAGAEPGILIKSIRQTQSLNPVILLDEIDKIQGGHRGHPAAVLCEVVDVSSNSAFIDNYLEVPVDLSGAIFIATANDKNAIYPPLRSRLEIVEMWGYEKEEKIDIAKGYLIPKLTELHKISGKLAIEEDALKIIVDRYTNEPGVRQLEHLLRRLCRRAAVNIASGNMSFVQIGAKDLLNVLGAAHLPPSRQLMNSQIGQVHVAHVFGNVARINCLKMEDKSGFTIVGKVSDQVRQITTKVFALIAREFISDMRRETLHLHIDIERLMHDADVSGFGLGIGLAMASAIKNIKLPSDLVVIGDVDLHGNVEGVNGLFPRIAAARRFNARKLILPRVHEDAGDYEHFPHRLIDEVDIIFVRTLEETFNKVGI